MMKNKTPVVVLGGSLNALGVVRSLSVAKMKIIVIEATKQCPCRWSKHCQFEFVASLDGSPLLNKLKSIAAKFNEKAVVIATDDRAVITISKYRDELAQLFIFSLPPDEFIHQLGEKTLFHQFAEKNNLPVPRSVIIRNLQDLSLLEKLSMPVAIKPGDKLKVGCNNIKRVARAANLNEAKEVVKEFLDGTDSIIVQEWIEGSDSEIYFSLFLCNDNGEIIGLFCGRKLVSTPPNIGSTGLCVQADVSTSKELENLTRKFLADVKYRGLGSVEYKRDTRSGKLFIVEPTVGRTDWQEEIATLCGINLPHMYYQSVLGKTVYSNAMTKTNIAWRSAFWRKPVDKKLWHGIQMQDAYFRLTDPMPAFYYYGYEEFLMRISNLIKRPSKLLKKIKIKGDRNDKCKNYN